MSKILFVSSSGGHYSELKILINKLSINNFIVVTETSPLNNKHDKIDYYLNNGSRKNLFKYIFVFIKNLYLTFYILLKEKPTTIISTGAHVCVMFFIIGWIFNIKTIYIESFAKVYSKSLSYKLASRFIDITYVQHKELLNVYKNSIYLGGLY